MQKLEEFGGLKIKTRKTRESVKLVRDCLSGCDYSGARNMGSEGQADKVSEANEKVIGTWSKSYLYYTIEKNLPALCPCLRTLWKVELKSDDLGYLAVCVCVCVSLYVVKHSRSDVAASKSL